MPSNYYLFFFVGLLPLIIGSLYYSPLGFQKIYMQVNGFKESPIEHKNKALIFGLTYLLGILMCLPLTSFCIHQSGVVASAMSTESGVWTPEAINDINTFLAKYGNNFRTFSHGLLHGVLLSILLVLPVLSVNALFEGRGWKYTLLHWGYWAICLGLMSGVLCATLVYDKL